VYAWVAMAFRTVPKTQLRARLKEELASLGDDALLITERGRAVAVTVTAERWNALQDRLDELHARVILLERQRGERPAWEALLGDP
jgi:PHD/YefM family antitoxin component YafN of YafNO toxin-antitoxin module